MSNLDKKIGAPSLPSVNLIPQEIAEATKMRAVRVTALLTVLVAVGVIIAGYVLALGAKQLAKGNLDDAMEQQSQAIAERDAQSTVYDAFVDYESDAWTLAQIGYGETRVGDLVFGIASLLGEGQQLSSIEFYGPTAEGSAQRNVTAISSPGVGSIEAVFNSESYESATALLADLEALTGLADVSGVTESYTNSAEVVAWQSTVTATVTGHALTDRFLQPDSPVVVDPEAVMGDEESAPAPQTSPSPQPSPSGEDQ